MNRRRRFEPARQTASVCLALALGMALAACPSPAPRDVAERDPAERDPAERELPAAERPEPAPPTTDVTCERFRVEALTVEARSRDEFRAALGEPRRVEWETVPNRHDPALTDTLFVLEYPGLVGHIHRPSGLGDLLARVDVRDNRYLAFPELGIGTAAERILAALGEPDERTDRQLLYLCDTGIEPEEPFLYVLEGGRVVELQFTYYVD